MKKPSSTTRHTLQFFWRSAARYPKLLVPIVLFMPLTIIVEQFLSTVVLSDILDRLANGDFVAGQVWQSFGGDNLLFAALLITGTILWRVVDILMWTLEGNVERDIANRIYNHLISQSASFHANRFGGSLV